MRDLKHLIFMEDLLQEANNDLVKQAKAEGRRALGYTCNFMPEVLLDLAGCFSVRLRAPRSGSPDMATYYMSARTCHFGRSLMERALEGGFNFLDAQMATETCTVTCRFQEHLMQKHLDSVKDMDIIQNPDFFCEFTDVPFKKTENSYLHYRRQLQAHVLDPLAQNFGIDTSDEALLKAIEQHNEVCRLITEIGSYRKLDVPTITGYEFHVIQLASLTCPKDLILPYLRETLEELKTRQPDEKPAFRARVAIVGSEIDDPQLTKLIEGCGALVVSDRYCFGSTPGREVIELKDDEDPLRQLCLHVMQHSECARYIADEKVQQRRDTADRLAREFKADGIIYEQMKYCDYWGFERALVSYIMHEEYNWPVLSIDRLYNNGNSGQLRTRVQAFVESLEIKRIQKNGGTK